MALKPCCGKLTSIENQQQTFDTLLQFAVKRNETFTFQSTLYRISALMKVQLVLALTGKLTVNNSNILG